MEIVEIFKTNVETNEHANQLVSLIHQHFPECSANFDLDDCDRILRVKSPVLIQEARLIAILQQQGVDAAVLTDEIPPYVGGSLLIATTGN